METKPKKRITLFNNKSENPKAPCFTGFITENDKKILKLSLWEKTTENGLKYFQGEITELEMIES